MYRPRDAQKLILGSFYKEAGQIFININREWRLSSMSNEEFKRHPEYARTPKKVKKK